MSTAAINAKSAHQPLLVSVITLTYNHERCISQCIDSVLAQSYPHWEQIILDDGSHDGTNAICRGYSDLRIRYFHQENRGPAALPDNYNTALRHARGDLIAILEGDDYWPSGKLECLVPPFADPDLVLAYGAVVDVGGDGRLQAGTSRTARRRLTLPESVRFNRPVGTIAKLLASAEGTGFIPASTVIMRRSALERIGGFRSRPGYTTIDYPTYLRLSLEGTFHFEPRVMGYYRRHLSSITSHQLENMFHHTQQVSREFVDAYAQRLGWTEAEIRSITESWSRSRDKIDFSVGQFMLARGRWRDARPYFQRAALRGEPLVRLASATGWICSWLHLDLDPFMRLAGRAALKGSS